MHILITIVADMFILRLKFLIQNIYDVGVGAGEGQRLGRDCQAIVLGSIPDDARFSVFSNRKTGKNCSGCASSCETETKPGTAMVGARLIVVPQSDAPDNVAR